MADKEARVKTAVVHQADGIIAVVYPDEKTAQFDTTKVLTPELEAELLKPINEIPRRLYMYGYWQKINDKAALPKGSTWEDKRAAQFSMRDSLEDGKWAEKRVSKSEKEKFLSVVESQYQAKTITKKQYEEALKLADTLYPG